MNEDSESNSHHHNKRLSSKSEKRVWYIKHGLINLFFIGCWYSFAFSLSIYNKWIFSASNQTFPFPLFTTSWHMFMQWLLSYILLKIFPHLNTAHSISWLDYFKRISPCAIATALDIGLSNLSLKTITLTFYTMCKSSSLIWVLIFAFIFKLEKPKWSLALIIVIIASGVVMMVATETAFVLSGAIEVLTATASGGLRWSLTQILLQKQKYGLNNPLIILYYLSPLMYFSLVILSLIFEGWSDIFSHDYFQHGFLHSLKSLALLLSPGFLAVGMVLSEFKLIERSSIITMSIAGIFKELLTIFIAATIFGDKLTPINVSGMVITIFGILIYNIIKYKQATDSKDVIDVGMGRSISDYEQVQMIEREDEENNESSMIEINNEEEHQHKV